MLLFLLLLLIYIKYGVATSIFVAKNTCCQKAVQSSYVHLFIKILSLFIGDFLAIGLDCRGAKQNYLDSTTNVARLQSFGLDAIAERRRPTILKKWDIFTNYVEENRQHIFYIFVFYVVTIALFIERFICK